MLPTHLWRPLILFFPLYLHFASSFSLSLSLSPSPSLPPSLPPSLLPFLPLSLNLWFLFRFRRCFFLLMFIREFAALKLIGQTGVRRWRIPELLFSGRSGGIRRWYRFVSAFLLCFDLIVCVCDCVCVGSHLRRPLYPPRRSFVSLLLWCFTSNWLSRKREAPPSPLLLFTSTVAAILFLSEESELYSEKRRSLLV